VAARGGQLLLFSFGAINLDAARGQPLIAFRMYRIVGD
jgi:hypothetical protein